MIVVLIRILQDGSAGEGALPDIGIRFSAWFIAMFLLAIGWALLHFRAGEIKEDRDGDPPDG